MELFSLHSCNKAGLYKKLFLKIWGEPINALSSRSVSGRVESITGLSSLCDREGDEGSVYIADHECFLFPKIVSGARWEEWLMASCVSSPGETKESINSYHPDGPASYLEF